jgi:hypothetical protein
MLGAGTGQKLKKHHLLYSFSIYFKINYKIIKKHFDNYKLSYYLYIKFIRWTQ